MSLDLQSARLDVADRDAWAILSRDERRRAERFVYDTDRTRFVAARATLRRLIAKRIGVPAQEIEFTYGPNGKPSLSPRFDSTLMFNVAHCDDLAVYAFANDGEIGVDVEAVRWFADADDVATRMFSPAEATAYKGLEALDRPLGFFQCWTRKEAFLKALGDGLGRPLDSFDVTLAPRESARILRVEDTPGEQCGWSIASFVPAAGFVAAVVYEQP